ncbi:MAG: hypothetical protein M3Z04_13615, partial [Chloroflexota bacterium]|nr:hypothetical protein [Chloroflexota bacterium]
MTQYYGPVPEPPGNEPAAPISGGSVPPYGPEPRYPAAEPRNYGAAGPSYPSAAPPYGAAGSGYPPPAPGGYAPPTGPFYGGAGAVPRPPRTVWPLVAGLLFVAGCLLGTLSGYIVGQLPGRARATA